MKTKEKVLKEEKCLICEKSYERRVQVRANRKNKGGRDNHAKLTCSPKCARAYNGIRKHFNYKVILKKEEFLAEVGKVIKDIEVDIDDGFHPIEKYCNSQELKQKLGIK